MTKIKRILTLTLVFALLSVVAPSSFAYEDDVNYPRSISPIIVLK